MSVVDGQTCTVRPFNDSYFPRKNVKTVYTVFAAETDEGQTVILKVNQALVKYTAVESAKYGQS